MEPVDISTKIVFLYTRVISTLQYRNILFQKTVNEFRFRNTCPVLPIEMKFIIWGRSET